MKSYSNALLKFILTHYCDILYCKVTPAEMGEYCKGKSGKNPLETALIWKADLDRAMVHLAPLMPFNPSEITSVETIIQIARSNDVSRMQRSLLSDCVLKSCDKVCKRTGNRGPELCYNEGIISRLRKYLNGEGRDDKGQFKKEASQ